MQVSKFRTPLGTIRMLASEQGLAAIYFPAQARTIERRLAPGGLAPGRGSVILLKAEAFLACYFDGDLHYLPECPIDWQGSPFQIEVWKALCAIPAGERVTYGEVATAIGRPKAVRAVGRAIGANPLSILVPCHRVVGSDGRLTGYAGGLEAKRYLLEHEARHAPAREAAAA